MKEIIENKTFEEERSLYGVSGLEVRNCHFGGPVDGESALKESNQFSVVDSSFSMRYVLWHSNDFVLERIAMDEATRAAIWYSNDGKIIDSSLHGIKVLRECSDFELTRCDIASDEFAWKCDDLRLKDCTLSSVYPFFMCADLEIENTKINAKYSFQYLKGGMIKSCQLTTKDAFWHAEDVTIRDSVVDSEYIGWYSKNLTFVNCRITGTQPFCYCKNVTLIDCTMENCDLAFEYSSVNAKLKGRIESIKNPLSGKIEVDEVGEIVRTGSVKKCHADILVGGAKQ